MVARRTYFTKILVAGLEGEPDFGMCRDVSDLQHCVAICIAKFTPAMVHAELNIFN